MFAHAPSEVGAQAWRRVRGWNNILFFQINFGSQGFMRLGLRGTSHVEPFCAFSTVVFRVLKTSPQLPQSSGERCSTVLLLCFRNALYDYMTSEWIILRVDSHASGILANLLSFSTRFSFARYIPGSQFSSTPLDSCQISHLCPILSIMTCFWDCTTCSLLFWWNWSSSLSERWTDKWRGESANC